jgi:hypothetical protein
MTLTTHGSLGGFVSDDPRRELRIDDSHLPATVGAGES